MTNQQRIELPKWLIGICVTVGIFLAMQTGGLIWMLSGMNTQQNHMSNDVMAIKLELQRAADDRFRGKDQLIYAAGVARQIDEATDDRRRL